MFRETVLHEFLCHSASGAILAVTSQADLVATDDVNSMRAYIAQHAEALYRHANFIRPIGERESLYIITGSVKTDAWAIAAYRQRMQSPHNILRLVQRPPRASEVLTPSSVHQWTKKGTSSRARLGDSAEHELKNQSLFLQGFKMELAPRFRSRIKESTLAPDLNPTKGTDGGDDDMPSLPDLDAPPESSGQGEGQIGARSDQAGRSSFGSYTLTLDGTDSSAAINMQGDTHGISYTAFHPQDQLLTLLHYPVTRRRRRRQLHQVSPHPRYCA